MGAREVLSRRTILHGNGEIRISTSSCALDWDLAGFWLLMWLGEQQVTITVETENVQAKGPEPRPQAADVLCQAAPDAGRDGLLPGHAEQTRKRDWFSGVVEQGHEQVVLGSRTGNDDAIDNHQMRCVTMLHHMPMQP
jgi:hypothetical protein